MVAIPYNAIKKVVWVSCMNDVNHFLLSPTQGERCTKCDVIHGLAPVVIPYYAIKKVVWVSRMNDVTHFLILHGLALVVIPYYAIKKGSLGVMHE